MASPDDNDQRLEKTVVNSEDVLDICNKAFKEFKAGDAGKAQDTLKKAGREAALLDDGLHHELVVGTGFSRRLIYRNNIAIVKEATLHPGIAEVVFRGSLDEGLKYVEPHPDIETAVLAEPFRSKFREQMNLVRYNLGLSWLMNPSYSRAALAAISHTIRQYPENPRLWLHAGEACIIFLSSKNDARWFKPLPKSYDLLCPPSEDQYASLWENHCIKKYIPFPVKQSERPTYEFADICLNFARRLNGTQKYEDKETKEERPINLWPIKENVTETEIAELWVPILTASAYVSLQMKNFRRTLAYCDALLKLRCTPDTNMALAVYYRDLALFLMGHEDYSVFHAPIFLGDLSDLPEEVKIVVERLNLGRKFQIIIAAIVDPGDFPTVLQELDSLLKESMDKLPRSLLVLCLYIVFRGFPDDTHIDIQRKSHILRSLLSRYSSTFAEEMAKMDRTNLWDQRNILPTGAVQQLIWYMVMQMRNIPVELPTDPPQPSDENVGNVDAIPRMPVMIKLSQKGGKTLRIPL